MSIRSDKVGFKVICDNCGQEGRIDKKDGKLYSDKFIITGNDEEYLSFLCTECLHCVDDN